MASNGRVISLGKVLWKIARRPIIKDLSDEYAAELAIDYLSLIGAPMAYSSRVTGQHGIPSIEINEYKGLLPDDLLYIEGVRYKPYGSCDYESQALRESSDTFHMATGCSELTEFTYKVQNNAIFTSFEDGVIEIAYKAIELDEQGFPFIPDNIKVKLGLEYYIIANYLSGLNDIGKVTDKTYNKYEQKSLFYMNAANSELNIPSPDKMETIMNGVTRILQRVNFHNDGFKNFGTRELFKRNA